MPLLTAFFDLNGTTTRKQALRVFLLLVLMIVGLAAIRAFAPDFERFGLPLFGLVYVWWLATVVRRLHEAGHSGAWTLLLLVPFAGIPVAFAALFLRAARPFNNSHAGLRVAGTASLVLLVIYWLTRAFWAPDWNVSDSMKPTLLVGDYVMTRYVDAKDLVRGDVVVFRDPVTNQPAIKRLIGLPGDQVQLQQGALVLNGARLMQTAVGTMTEIFAAQGAAGILPRCTNGVVGIGGACDLALARESLADGRSWLIGNLGDDLFGDDTTVFRVPEGRFFFLGDNRDNSADSRLAQGAGGLGFVPAENVIGRVTGVLFSSAGAYLWQIGDWRGDRIFRAVE